MPVRHNREVIKNRILSLLLAVVMAGSLFAGFDGLLARADGEGGSSEPGIQKDLVCGYESEHEHSEECYALGDLVCELEESAGHSHNGDCYAREAVCGLDEADGHVHDDECYEISADPVCGLNESAGHVHGVACYEQELICDKEEHKHTDECYAEEENGTAAPAQQGDNVLSERLQGIADILQSFLDAAAGYDDISNLTKEEYEELDALRWRMWDDYDAAWMELTDEEQEELETACASLFDKVYDVIGRMAEGEVSMYATGDIPVYGEADLGIRGTFACSDVLDSYEGLILQSGNDYILQNDVNISCPIIVDSGASVTIDLNGHKLDRGLSSGIKGGFVILVKGSLRLTDSSAGGNGVVTGGDNRAYESGYDLDYYGGGVSVTGGTLTFDGGSISGNKANFGAGIGVKGSGTVTIASGATVSSNNASYGGGIGTGGSSVNVTNHGAITGNTASFGGGVYFQNGDFYNHGDITENTATDGGGVYGCDVNTTNCSIYNQGNINDNKAERSGGGIYCDNPNVVVENNGNINGNQISGSGPGDYNGAGIYLSDGKFTNNGHIDNNSSVASCRGAGVMADQCVFINNGSICGNSSAENYSDPGYAGGIWCNTDLFTVMSGSVIKDNTNGWVNSNIVLPDPSKEVTVGAAMPAEASMGVSILRESSTPGIYSYRTGSFSNGYGTYNGGQAPSSYFFSDNPGCQIKLSASGEAMISQLDTGVYYVLLDPNGGTVNGSAVRITVYTDSAGKLAVMPTPIRETYTFDGWYTEKDGGSKIEPGTAFDRSGALLFAHWSQKKQIWVTGLTAAKTYDGTTAVSVSGRPKLNGLEYGDNVDITLGTPSFESPNAGSRKVIYSSYELTGPDAGKYTLTGPVSFYGTIRKKRIFIDKYETDDRGVITKVDFRNLVSGETLTFGEDYRVFPFSMTDTYYPKVYGSVSLNSTEKAGNYDLESERLEGTVHRVTFDGNGASYVLGSPMLTNVKFKLDSLPGAPIRAYYTFVGWFTARDGGTRITTDTYFGAQETTVYAHWSTEPLKVLHVSGIKVKDKIFDNGQEAEIDLANSNIVVTGIEAGDDVQFAPVEARFNTRLAGNDRTATFIGARLTGEDAWKYTTIIEDATADIYKREINATGACRFDENGDLAGVIFDYPAANAYLVLGRDYTVTDFTPDPVTPHKSNATVILNGSTVEGGNYILKDNAVSANTYTITFNTNGGHALSPGTAETKPGGKLASLPVPNRDGYVFTGWYTDAAGGDPVTVNTVFTGDTTIYAQWGETVRVKINGIYSENKTYDGTVKAAIKGTSSARITDMTGNPINTAHDVKVDASAAKAEFADKNVGIRDVTFSGFSLSGADAYRYVLAEQPASVRAEITKKEITLVDYTPDPGGTASIVNVEFGGLVDGESLDIGTDYSVSDFVQISTHPQRRDRAVVTLLSTTKANNYVLRDNAIIIPGYKITFDANIEGNLAGHDYLTTDFTGRLPRLVQDPYWRDHFFLGWFTEPVGGEQIFAGRIFYEDTTVYAHWKDSLEVFIDGIYADDKVYDGTRTAAVLGRDTAVIKDIGGNIIDDGVTIRIGNAEFSDKNTGEWEVTFSGFSLGGMNAAKYELVRQPENVTAKITPKGITPDAVITDRNRKAVEVIFSGLVEGERLEIDTDYEVSDFQTDTSTTPHRATATVTLKNTLKASNYFLLDDKVSIPLYVVTFEPMGGSVEPTTMQADFSGKLDYLPTPARDGEYTFDGWYTAATGGTKVSVDTIYNVDTVLYAHWNTPEPPPPPAAKIPIVITGLRAQSREYDGTLDAQVIGTPVLNGLIAGDEVTLVPGTAAFIDKNAGSAKTVIFGGYSLSGKDADEYILTGQPASTTADITKKPITIRSVETDAARTVKNVLFDGLVGAERLTMGTDYTVSGYTVDKTVSPYVATARVSLGTTLTASNYVLENGNIRITLPTGSITFTVRQGTNAPATSASMSDSNKRSTLNTIENTALNEGKNVGIYLDVEALTENQVPSRDRGMIDFATPNATGRRYFDLTPSVQVLDSTSQSRKLSSFTDTVPVTITIPVAIRTAPSGYTREFGLAAYHSNDSEAELIYGTYNSKNYTITFNARRFSTYAIYYRDVERSSSDSSSVRRTYNPDVKRKSSPPPPPAAAVLDRVPKTDELPYIIRWFILAFISGIGAVYFGYKGLRKAPGRKEH